MVHLLSQPAAVQAWRPLLPGDELLQVVEDFSHGPLADADAIDPQARTAWWNRIWWSMRWLPDADEVFLLDYWRCRKQLFRVFTQRQPLCLWLGDGAHARLLLDMLCAHAHATQPLSVVDMGSVEAVDDPRPLLAGARMLSARERADCAAEWVYWQQQGRGWRAVHAGKLTEYPADCFDALLLELLARNDRQPAAGLVDMAMRYQSCAGVSAHYLFWRLAMLAEAGLVQLTPQPAGPPLAALRPDSR